MLSSKVKLWITVCAFGLTVFLTSVSCTAAESGQGSGASAEQILQRLTAFYGGVQGFAVDVRYEMSAPDVDEPDADESGERYRDNRHVAVSLPNRVSVKPLGDGEGEFVCDGTHLLATMPSLKRYVQQDAGADIDALLADPASVAMSAGRLAVELAGSSPLGNVAAKTGIEYSLLEPQAIGGELCDGFEMAQGMGAVVAWVQQGPQPLLRKLEWKLRQTPDTETDEQNPAAASMPVIYFDNWVIDGEFPEDAFALVVPDDMEQVDSLVDQGEGEEVIHPLLGKPAPECELALLGGDPAKLQDYVGKKAVVIDFWASWCQPCMMSLPSLAKVATDYANREVAFYTVNLGDDEETVRELLKKKELDLPVVMDPENALGDLFSVSGIPLSIIIDKKGTVQVAEAGVSEDHEKTLAAKIEAVLAGEPLAEQALAAAKEQRNPVGPIPQDPDATTELNVAAEKLAYNQRTLIDAYKAHGSRDPAWDDRALQLLEEVAHHFSSAEGCKTREEIVAMAEPLLADGCDDPLIKYCYAALFQDSDSGEEAQAKAFEILKECYDGLVDRGYPANRRYSAVNRLWKRYRDIDCNSAETAQYLKLRIKEVLACIELDNLANNEGRNLATLVTEVYEDLSIDQKAAFYERAKAWEEKQPFLVNLIGGDWHYDAAWKTRGHGWASKVTEEGWKGFSEHLAEARACFTKAWEAAPRRPEAATRMISIAMSDSNGPPAREMRLWFDRAVEAQFDYKQAYRNLLNGLMPRWHGSFGAIYQFGLQCKQTERYDTDVPYMFCEALWLIAKDNQNSLGFSVLNRPGLYEVVHDLCQHYIEVAKFPNNAAWWKSVDLGFAYCAENWDTAAAILDEIKEETDVDAFGRFPLIRENVIADVRLHTSPQADELMEALSQGEHDERNQAIERLTKLAEEDDLHPLLRGRINSRLRELQWLTEFDSGEPVSLEFNQAFDGWKIEAGWWTANNDGSVQGISSSVGVIMLCGADFGPRWELSGEWEYGKSPYNPWDAGIMLYRDGSLSHNVMYNPSEHWLAIWPHDSSYRHQGPLEREGNVVPFKLRLNDGVINVWIGEEHVVKHEELVGWPDEGAIQFAIGAKYRWNGSTLTYRNLKIKKTD